MPPPSAVPATVNDLAVPAGVCLVPQRQSGETTRYRFAPGKGFKKVNDNSSCVSDKGAWDLLVVPTPNDNVTPETIVQYLPKAFAAKLAASQITPPSIVEARVFFFDRTQESGINKEKVGLTIGPGMVVITFEKEQPPILKGFIEKLLTASPSALEELQSPTHVVNTFLTMVENSIDLFLRPIESRVRTLKRTVDKGQPLTPDEKNVELPKLLEQLDFMQGKLGHAVGKMEGLVVSHIQTDDKLLAHLIKQFERLGNRCENVLEKLHKMERKLEDIAERKDQSEKGSAQVIVGACGLGAAIGAVVGTAATVSTVAGAVVGLGVGLAFAVWKWHPWQLLSRHPHRPETGGTT